MFTKFYDTLYDGLIKVLATILGTEHDPVKRLARALQEIRATLQTLRSKVLSRPFPSKQIEIGFFKTIKPKFYALRVFHLELYNLDMNKPAGTKEILYQFYRQELQIIDRFFKQNGFLYQYYKAGFTEMDNLYFVRGVEVPAVLTPEQADTDPQFSTVRPLLRPFYCLRAIAAGNLRPYGRAGRYGLAGSAEKAQACPVTEVDRQPRQYGGTGIWPALYPATQ